MNDAKILMIEDNEEVREFVTGYLESEYAILEAGNGGIGLNIAMTELPDLIITDVSMPEMDGNELCRILKHDERTSHIPVIMLTAKVAVEQQIEGLENGADLYLTKPFSIKVLRSYIINLLKAKELMRQQYSQKILLEPSGVEVGTVDKKFMEKLMKIVERNLGQSDFHVKELAEELGMSKAVLYKKFNALVKTPIGEFIKSMRLKKAALIFTNDKKTVSEVTWEVGFTDLKHFSNEFKRAYGKSPSEFILDHRKKD